MLARGELDAALLCVAGGDLVDRSTRTFRPGSGIRPLFPTFRPKARATSLAANTEVLETVCQYSLEQRLTNRLIGLDELFHPATLEL